MANAMFNLGKKEILDGSIDLSVDTIRVLLVTSSYTFDANDDYYDEGGADDPIDHELSGTGYTAKGEALGSKAITEDDPNNRAEFDAADVTWSSINAGTAAAAIVYKDTGVATTSTLIAYIDSGFPVTTNGGDLTIQWDGEGIIQLT